MAPFNGGAESPRIMRCGRWHSDIVRAYLLENGEETFKVGVLGCEGGMALRHSRTPPGRWSLPVMWEATIAPSSSVRGGLR